MKKAGLLIVITVFSSVLMAQEKEFEEYLSHCKEIELPFGMTDSTARGFFPEPEKNGTEVPANLIHKFIAAFARPINDGYACDDGYVYRYYYGIKTRIDNFIIVMVYQKEIYNYHDDGMPEDKTLLQVYTSDGVLTGSMTIDKANELYFFDSQFSAGDTPDCILSIQTIQGSMVSRIEYPVYRGMLEYLEYSVNDIGVISCKRTKTEKVITKFGETPFYRAEVIERGWSSAPAFAGIWQKQIYDPEYTIDADIGGLDSIRMTPGASFKIVDDNDRFTNLFVDKRQAMISGYGTFDFLTSTENMEKSFTNPDDTRANRAISCRFVGNNYLLLCYPSDDMEVYAIWDIWKRVEGGNPFTEEPEAER
jgi:hypothetical protein